MRRRRFFTWLESSGQSSWYGGSEDLGGFVVIASSGVNYVVWGFPFFWLYIGSLWGFQVGVLEISNNDLVVYFAKGLWVLGLALHVWLLRSSDLSYSVVLYSHERQCARKYFATSLLIDLRDYYEIQEMIWDASSRSSVQYIFIAFAQLWIQDTFPCVISNNSRVYSSFTQS